jgi:hypothetical protein
MTFPFLKINVAVSAETIDVNRQTNRTRQVERKPFRNRADISTPAG